MKGTNDKTREALTLTSNKSAAEAKTYGFPHSAPDSHLGEEKTGMSVWG